MSAVATAALPAPGQTFRDCADCPEMVVVPSGSFALGGGDPGLGANARPVAIPRPFAIGTFEVTISQWLACRDDGGCGDRKPSNPGFDGPDRPVVDVSFADVSRYLRWLSERTGQAYRLPTEAEWEYAAKAGTETAFWWGAEPGSGHANCFGCGSSWDGRGPAPVGSFAANPFGLYDTAGNVWEWVGDCHAADGYRGFDGYPAARPGSGFCDRVVRGGGWDIVPDGIRATFRFNADPVGRLNTLGFRVVRE